MINPRTGRDFLERSELPSQTLEIPTIAYYKFAEELSLDTEVVLYKDEEFLLRAGGKSHYYVDGRGPLTMELSRGEMLAKFVLAKANVMGLMFDNVCGMGVGGTAFAEQIQTYGKLTLTQANDCKDPGQRYGYGLWGGPVKDRDVLVVDDTLTSGDSLSTTIEMVQQEGGKVPLAIVAIDRSIPGTIEKLSEKYQTNVDSIFYFEESSGLILPNL